MEKQVEMSSNPELPLDVMLEIFSHLPTRSVGRFCTLSKLYNNLLSESTFINKHLSHASTLKLIVKKSKAQYSGPNRSICSWTNSFYSYPPQDLTSYKDLLSTRSSSFYELDNDLTSKKLATSGVNYLSKEIVGEEPVSLLGSCNGLFCLINEHARPQRLALWNPTTMEFDCLPTMPETKLNPFGESSEFTSRLHYGFGHDPVNDDYKVVCVICCISKNQNEFQILDPTPISNTTYIYSHRMRCWKEIELAFPPYCIIDTYGDGCQFLHGKVHWVAYTSLNEEGGRSNQYVVSLDLATERCGIVPRPPSDHPSDQLNVCVLGEYLCFYINSYSMLGRDFEMWIMKEYGVEKSWFQLLTIPIAKFDYFNNSSPTCVPLLMMKSGEILFKVDEEFEGKCIYLYNPKTCNFIFVEHEHHHVSSLSGHIYVESLVKTKL